MATVSVLFEIFAIKMVQITESMLFIEYRGYSACLVFLPAQQCKEIFFSRGVLTKFIGSRVSGYRGEELNT